MAKVDLTGKLGLGEKHEIVVGDVTLTVDDSAPTILQLLSIMGEDFKPQDVDKAVALLFGKDGKKTIDGMKLSFADLFTLVNAASELVMGETAGEAETLATT